jgi:phosphoglycolate phosphatase
MQAIMFDLDGTLLDTLEDLGDAMNLALTEGGHAAHDYPFYRHAIGDGASMLVQRSLPTAHRDAASVAAMLRGMQAHYAELWDTKTHLYDGVGELLDELTARSLPMTVFSNKPNTALQDCVTRFFAPHTFAMARGAMPGRPVKPDPTPALEMTAALGIPAEQWLYVGDTNTDMLTAIAAGMHPVGCTWGFRDRAELLEYGAAAIIDHPRELLGLLHA